MEQTGPFISKFGVENHGLKNVETVHWNYRTPQLYEAALRRREGVLSSTRRGAISGAAAGWRGWRSMPR